MEAASQFVKTFEENAILLSQQKMSKFRSKCTVKTPGATEKHSFRSVAARGDMTDRANVGANAGKRPDTAYADTVYYERLCGSTPCSSADSFNKPDLNRMLQDTESVLYRTMLPQANRKIDDRFVVALYANAVATDTTVFAYGATGTNPTIGGEAQEFNKQIVAQMLEAFNTDEVDEDEEKFFAVTPACLTKLLDTEEYTSVDYAMARALVDGKLIGRWMGFTWVMSNRLTGPAAGQKYYPAWTRDAMGMLLLQDITFDSGREPGKQFDTTVQVSLDCGFVRIQDEKVKRLHVLE